MSNKKIIILGTKPYAMYANKHEWEVIFKYSKNNKYVVKISSGIIKYDEPDKFLQNNSKISECTVILVNGKNYMINGAFNSREAKDDLNKIVGSLLKDKEILFASHTWPSLDLQNVQISSYSSAEKDKYEVISALAKANNSQNNDFTSEFNKLWELLQKLPTISAFSFFKHKIAHLFLSIDMDLQGIAEIKKREDNKEIDQNKSIDYLKEVLTDKRDKIYYKKALDDLHFMIVNKKFECERPGNNTELEKKSILDLIDDKKDTDTIKKEWNELTKLCGLIEKDDGISSNKDSIIWKFMKMMDEKASKNEIDNKDVNDILEFFKKDENKIQGINSFHDWFCALDNCLEKIRESVK